MRVSERERLTDLYFCLKSVPTELWSGSDYLVVSHALSDKKLSLSQCMFFHILGRVAHQVSDEIEFLKCIKQEDLPPIDLSDEESQLLKEGIKKGAKSISKGSLGGASDSLRIFQFYYAQAA